MLFIEWALLQLQEEFARQLVTHGHILVDSKRVDIPSYRVEAGQKIEIREKSKENPQIQELLI